MESYRTGHPAIERLKKSTHLMGPGINRGQLIFKTELLLYQSKVNLDFKCYPAKEFIF